MPWTNQGGGDGGGGGGPWGRGPQGPQPPNLEDVLRRGQDRMRGMMPGGFGGAKGVIGVGIILLIIWALTGLYRVDAGEQGVALLFGERWQTTGPGLHWNFPVPIGTREIANVERINRTEVGLRTSGDGGRSTAARDITEESLMLTGDENIIDIQYVVLWKISDAGDFLFNVRNQEQTVKNVAESAMREVVGRTGFEFARTQGRGEIQVAARDLIQETLDHYNAGILVTSVELQKVDPPSQVIGAFRDVQAARADKERMINEAQAEFNRNTRQAEGEAVQITRAAEAYKEEKIAMATGDASRFLSVFEQYRRNPDVTTRRVYLETMESVFGGMDKVLIDNQSGTLGAVPYLPLDQLIKNRGVAAGGNN